MDEKTAQESMQDWLQALVTFADADVTINDYSLFDSPQAGGPFVIIENSDGFGSVHDGYTPQDVWEIPVLLLVAFAIGDDPDTTTFNNFRDTRQIIINEANDRTGNRTPVAGSDVTRIRNGTPIISWYQAGADPNQPGSYPSYIMQQLIFQVVTF